MSELYEETKTMVKEQQRRRWLQHHPDFNSRDSSYQLSREYQVIIVQLRTGHSRLRHHMFTKFLIGESCACHCGTSPMTMEHFQQDCQNHQNLRAETWPADTLEREIYGPVENLQCRAACVWTTRVLVWANDKEFNWLVFMLSCPHWHAAGNLKTQTV